MAKTYQYCVAENWGKGFIDHVEAQAIVDAEVTAAQAAWDALSDEDKEDNPRPADITLTE
mgnify:CR=1 FL=1